MTTSRGILNATLDVAMILKDAGAVTTSGAAQVGGVARVLNVGPAFMQGVFTVDFNVLDLTSADEGYEVRLQASSDPTFASDVSVIATLRAGTATGNSAEGAVGIGRRQAAFVNVSEDGKPLQYLRAYIVVSGTTPSINCQAFIGQNPLNG